VVPQFALLASSGAVTGGGTRLTGKFADLGAMAERPSAKHSAQVLDIARSTSCGALVSRHLSRFDAADGEDLTSTQ
jgi:hypothetical protein